MIKFSDYLLDLLVHKVEYPILSILDNLENYTVYRKFLRLALITGNKQVINYIETFLARQNNLHCMLILLEEEVAYGYDTRNAEILFLEICDIKRPSLDLIDKFLSITNKSYIGLTQQLLQNKLYLVLGRIIYLLGPNSKDIELIVLIVLQSFNSIPKNNALYLACEIIIIAPNYISSIISVLSCDDLITYILSMPLNMGVVIHFAQFLSDGYLSDLVIFEKRLISIASPAILIQYAANVEASNKRLILQQLIERRARFNDEKHLVDFIQSFPEYRSLLPLL